MFNVHLFFHLWQARKQTGVPLWRTSAEPFEAMYAVARRCYFSGTRNVPKQIMENCYLRVKYECYFRSKVQY